MSRLMPASTSTRTTSPKRRRRSSSSTACSRSSASSETVKSASRVTRKTAVSTISMPGKSGSRCLAIRSSSGTNVRPSAERHEAREHLLRHLHARERPACAVCGSRTTHAERQRQVRDVGERPPEADRQRRQDGEDLAPEALVERSRSLLGRPRRGRRCGCRARSSAGRRSRSQAARPGAPCARAHDARGSRRASRRGRAAVLQRRLDAGVDLVVQAGDADHEELVEVVRGRSRENFSRSSSGTSASSASCEHALVELQPRQLAVEVQRGVRRGRSASSAARPAAVRRCSRALDRSRGRATRDGFTRAASSSRTPSRKPAAADLQRPAERVRRRVEHESAPRASAARARGRVAKRARDLRRRRRPTSTPHRALQRLAGRARRRRAAAATPRCRRPPPRRRPAGSVEALEHAVRRARASRAARRPTAGPSAGRRRSAGPSRRGRTPTTSTPSAQRADRELGRAAADVDHADACRRAAARACASRPRKASRASSVAVEDLDLDAAGVAQRGGELVPVGGARGSPPWRPRASRRAPSCSTSAALLGDDARDLGDLLARDLAALQALAEAGERAPLQHLARGRRPRRRRPARAWCWSRCRCRRRAFARARCCHDGAA